MYKKAVQLIYLILTKIFLGCVDNLLLALSSNCKVAPSEATFTCCSTK